MLKVKLLCGQKDAFKEPCDYFGGPELEGVVSVLWINGGYRLYTATEADALKLSDYYGWWHMDDCIVWIELVNELIPCTIAGVGDVFFGEMSVEEKPASKEFPIMVGELAAALMEGLFVTPKGSKQRLHDELYTLSDSGMVGVWMCCAEVASAAELRYGDVWASETRSFLDDSDYMPTSIVAVARYIGKQPQGPTEIYQVLAHFEQHNPHNDNQARR